MPTPAPALRVTVLRSVPARRATVHVAGELDLGSLAPLREALHRCLSAGISTIDIDTRDVTFCDVCGLTLLSATAARRAALSGGILTARRPSAPVAHLLDLADTTAYLIPAPGPPPSVPGHAPSAAAGYAS
ncbi:STAS domain-containing protein [Streptomyces sp. NRRL B-24484]|uniref:STAS domain-containing protein n=1 Tax=Streptomyces sp. NRRL B-24484 TaxID=1463833 RepID=UPI0006939371|nr:STAS domain-containing protein [Streptomyces sp. NRRL B-24484]